MSESTSGRAASVMRQVSVSAMGSRLRLELAMAMLAVSVVPERLR
jgi:hypothetical protein